MMAGIHGKNTKPELIVRRMLFALDYRVRLHRPANRWCPKPAQTYGRVLMEGLLGHASSLE